MAVTTIEGSLDALLTPWREHEAALKLGQRATFGLVHGAGHGAWCWQDVSESLKRAGHEVSAVDMPVDDPNASVRDYAEAVAAPLKGRENVVLVGHSMAGIVIPEVADLVPVKQLIYLNAALRLPGTSLDDPIEGDMLPPRNNKEYLDSIVDIGQGLSTISPEDAKHFFYHDCADDVVESAAMHLRPQSGAYRRERSKQDNWPTVPSAYVLSEDDRVVNPEWSEIVAREWLGVEAVRLPGGHSPFLSRPRHLANTLISLI